MVVVYVRGFVSRRINGPVEGVWVECAALLRMNVQDGCESSSGSNS